MVEGPADLRDQMRQRLKTGRVHVLKPVRRPSESDARKDSTAGLEAELDRVVPAWVGDLKEGRLRRPNHDPPKKRRGENGSRPSRAVLSLRRSIAHRSRLGRPIRSFDHNPLVFEPLG